jgi:hypothetical protein
MGNPNRTQSDLRPWTSHNFAFHSSSAKKRAGVVLAPLARRAIADDARESFVSESRAHRPTDRRHLKVAFGRSSRESNDARSGRVTRRLPPARSR